MNYGNKASSLFVARGSAYLYPDSGTEGHILTDKGDIKAVPELLFLFWEQFKMPSAYMDAKESFCATGLPGELFDASLDALVEIGLIAEQK